MRPPGNLMLAAFGPDIEFLRPHLRAIHLAPGQVLTEPGEPIDCVYFLLHGAVSKMTVFEDGTEIECLIVGREGAVGLTSILGVRRALTRNVCHMPVRAYVIEAGRMTSIVRAAPHMRQVIDRYAAWMLSCGIRNGACNARHAVEPRLCRWLLTCCDLLDTREIRLPQDVFAKMLGVQRTSVNPILQHLRSDSLIDLGRSRLTVMDSRSLRTRACECYAAGQAAANELWAPFGHDGSGDGPIRSAGSAA